MNRQGNSFEKRLSFDFYLVLDALDVSVPDSAKRHGASVAFRSVVAFGHIGGLST
ncbi:MAG TPA: hypothetical protein VMF91_19940 [Bryobacteraceae bacterium]|nr:hypothetical protein [Bryobacteraceae bacterium]